MLRISEYHYLRLFWRRPWCRGMCEKVVYFIHFCLLLLLIFLKHVSIILDNVSVTAPRCSPRVILNEGVLRYTVVLVK